MSMIQIGGQDGSLVMGRSSISRPACMQCGVVHTDKATFESISTKYFVRSTLYCSPVAKSRYRPGSGLAGRSSPASYYSVPSFLPSSLDRRVPGCPAAAWKSSQGWGGAKKAGRVGTWLFARAAAGRPGTRRLVFSAVAVGRQVGRQQQELFPPPLLPSEWWCSTDRQPPHLDSCRNHFSVAFWLSDNS